MNRANIVIAIFAICAEPPMHRGYAVSNLKYALNNMIPSAAVTVKPIPMNVWRIRKA
jgi:hypothetical protein